MHKRSIKSFALFLIASLMLACFVGCQDGKDVYGAASEFIRVNHPETSSNDAFSDDASDVSQSNSSGNGSSAATSSNDASDVSSTDSSESSSGNSSETATSSDSSSVIVNESDKDDYGPVILF